MARLEIATCIAGHAEPNDRPLPLRKAVVTVTNNSILRALCRSQLRAVRREKPCPSGSRLPRRGRFCASMHPGVTCCPPRARNGSVFWRKRLWSTKLISLASRQTCRSRRAKAPVSHAPASQRVVARPAAEMLFSKRNHTISLNGLRGGGRRLSSWRG